ncbi:hypothetical protein DL764_008260 [Monosporascus ibericus]|uniref:Ribosomal RNA methyltransferase FtsJ domain-containing protein n=1 Tax=Monosporascus ibericus TaxID=155417 RepID=A0A4Q4SXY2_9PEZI|nr:hypothetical protein DL764_008260 [Monosporascus ibericus]
MGPLSSLTDMQQTAAGVSARDELNGVDVQKEKRTPALIHQGGELQQRRMDCKAGWKNPDGDKLFEKQRRTTDEADGAAALYFYRMIETTYKSDRAALPSRILDMGAAPGGFIEMAVEQNPEAQVVTFSLPVSEGGHKMMLQPENNPNVTLNFIDITMLAADMGMPYIPAGHPDAANFVLSLQFDSSDKQEALSDLVLCDGQVLRTHSRATYRETREARWLTSTQRALGLGHLRPGGTIVAPLYKLEAWDALSLLSCFS